jgi:hypothetical protein
VLVARGERERTAEDETACRHVEEDWGTYVLLGYWGTYAWGLCSPTRLRENCTTAIVSECLASLVQYGIRQLGSVCCLPISAALLYLC